VRRVPHLGSARELVGIVVILSKGARATGDYYAILEGC
jgi:hypothetical protein